MREFLKAGDLAAMAQRAAAAQAIAEAATPGPWAFEHTGESSWGVGVVDPHPDSG